MKAQSSVYVKLQNLYKAKARKDAQEVLEFIRESAGGEHVNPTEVDLFCKNARFVKLINANRRGLDLGQLFGKFIISNCTVASPNYLNQMPKKQVTKKQRR